MHRRTAIIGGASLAALGVGATWTMLRHKRLSAEYRDAQRAMRSALATEPHTIDLVRFAALAPNGHNTQPWLYSASPGRLVIRPDFSRRTPVVDPDDHHLWVSLGCAAENLALSAAARGLRGEPRFMPDGAGHVDFAYERGVPIGSPLFEAIPIRQSTRNEYDGRSASVKDLRVLSWAAEVPGLRVVFLTDRRGMDAIRDLVVEGNSAQLRDQAFMRELTSWLRFSPAHALAMGDGLYAPTTGNPALPEWLGRAAFRLMVGAQAENDKYARQLRSSAGIAVFVGERADRDHWVRVGRASQRFALQATALGMKVAYVNQPVEVPSLRGDLSSLVGIPGARPDLVMRFGYGPSLPYAPRRPPHAVISELR